MRVVEATCVSEIAGGLQWSKAVLKCLWKCLKSELNESEYSVREDVIAMPRTEHKVGNCLQAIL